MAGAIILQGLAIIFIVIDMGMILHRLNKQEDTMVQVLLALAILLQEYDKKHNKNHRKKNNKATKKGE